jgi:deoxyribodipyrimidine photo-lyase
VKPAISGVQEAAASVRAAPRATQLLCTAAAARMPRTIIWFRNDLRLHDNPIVAAAVEAAKQGHEIVPLFCFDNRSMSIHNVIDQRPSSRMTGEVKMGPYRAKFVMQSVNALQKKLQEVDSDLLIHYDRPEKVIPGAELD